ncbi:MAG: hypothetical protein LBI01_06700 [Elusimicrobium sp.]|jgi:hypothetical protein|nr:hypothetical protein [Elusimicrobium sp.]
MTFLERMTLIANRAVKKAQDNNRRKGLPNVYSIDGKIIYVLPNGKITTKYNFKKIKK